MKIVLEIGVQSLRMKMPSCWLTSYETSSIFRTHNFLYVFKLFVVVVALGLPCCTRELLCSCDAQAPHCGGFSWWGARALGHTSFSSCSSQAALELSSVVVVYRLSCPLACGILVPWPGIEPVSPAMAGRFLSTGPPGKSPGLITFKEGRRGSESFLPGK